MTLARYMQEKRNNEKEMAAPLQTGKTYFNLLEETVRVCGKYDHWISLHFNVKPEANMKLFLCQRSHKKGRKKTKKKEKIIIIYKLVVLETEKEQR